jgi:general secretion pathway protein G
MSRPRTDRNNRAAHRDGRRAFTLLEVIVVVTIIALLATLVAPRVLSNIGKSKQKIAEAEVNSIAQQVQLWMADNGMSSLPDDFDLMELTQGSNPYLREKDLYDPWDRMYVLRNPGESNPDFDIVTFGADGEPGGEDENNDVVN